MILDCLWTCYWRNRGLFERGILKVELVVHLAVMGFPTKGPPPESDSKIENEAVDGLLNWEDKSRLDRKLKSHLEGVKRAKKSHIKILNTWESGLERGGPDEFLESLN